MKPRNHSRSPALLVRASPPLAAAGRGRMPAETSKHTAGIFDISAETLKDKIRGGWAGQTIGCTFGGRTEFQFQGTIIPDYQPLPWDEAGHRRRFQGRSRAL